MELDLISFTTFMLSQADKKTIFPFSFWNGPPLKIKETENGRQQKQPNYLI